MIFLVLVESFSRITQSFSSKWKIGTIYEKDNRNHIFLDCTIGEKLILRFYFRPWNRTVEPRRREHVGRRGYSPRRTQSSSNRVEMYFSEVDVDVRQPRSREPTTSLT